MTREIAAAALELLAIDFDAMDKRTLRTMAHNYKGGPLLGLEQ